MFNILQENITTFGQHIIISFDRQDSSAVTLWYDYANGVQIFRFLLSGEEELGQGGVTRAVCYATFFDRESLVPVNAMYKLRQRNANVVRFAEWDKGREEIYLDRKIETVSADALSEQLASLCADTEYIYTRQTDLQSWMSSKGAPKLTALNTSKVLLKPAQQVHCSSDPAPWAPCACRLTACIHWYPCALRYCENNGVCGIRTCSKCYDMYHTEDGRRRCII
ncbi:out at first protein-like isoform X2 [Varroa jacobsoni]|uniref:Out at first protein n=1 Tax=Varroa destructor TaxID=109461 RepID=A0A7M7JEJ0_VARDE|nr:out at first protein-like isoform X2 [Varroa destructor]XP_022698132.1 out at first protein-like isoform X2 [Varroa jacobsoni]